MDNHTDLDPVSGVQRKLFVEFGCLLIVSEEQCLVDPVEHEIENASEGIQDWKPARVHQDAEQV